jgi:hypothetical protein
VIKTVKKTVKKTVIKTVKKTVKKTVISNSLKTSKNKIDFFKVYLCLQRDHEQEEDNDVDNRLRGLSLRNY